MKNEIKIENSPGATIKNFSDNKNSFNLKIKNIGSFISRNKEPMIVSIVISLFCSILANLIFYYCFQ